MSSTSNREDAASEVRIPDILAAIARWKRIIFTSAAVGIGAGILVALLVPRQYKSMARVLPPRSSDLLGGLGAVSSLVKALPLNVGKLGSGLRLHRAHPEPHGARIDRQEVRPDGGL